jgi:hypothetical protein
MVEVENGRRISLPVQFTYISVDYEGLLSLKYLKCDCAYFYTRLNDTGKTSKKYFKIA